MKILENAPQGSDAWHAERATRFCASEAAAALGVSKYSTRDALLKQKATGIAEDVTPAKQRIFDAGHQSEADAGPIAEQIAGVDFYPAVGIADIEGLPLLSSFDGIDIMEEILWENKLLSAALVEQVRMGQLEPHYWAQLEHQLLVSNAKKVLFTTSDGTPEGTHSLWYESMPDRRQQVIAAWKQFAIDLSAYVTPAATAPAPTGRAPETLPALFISVKGEVTDSNLANFKEVALAAIRSVNRELSTDQDFADADKAVKWCSDIEERVAGAKQNALSQTASIDALFKTMDDISAEARQVRIDLDRLIKARKVSLKTELLVGVQTQLADHLRSLNARIGRDYMPHTVADFAAAVYGKKNFDSMRSALNAALANAKIEANAVADRISANMATLTEHAKGFEFLFVDQATIVLKATDDLTALVKTRIADHKAAELVKEEATRSRIQVEEQAKAEATARAKVLVEQEAERVKVQRMSAIQAQAEKVAADFAVQQNAPQIIQEIIRPAPLTAQDIADGVVDAEIEPAANVVSLRASQAAPAVQTPPSMKLGDLNAMLSPITLTADGLEALGFPVAAMVKGAKLYYASDLGHICAALVKHINSLQARQAA